MEKVIYKASLEQNLIYAHLHLESGWEIDVLKRFAWRTVNFTPYKHCVYNMKVPLFPWCSVCLDSSNWKEKNTKCYDRIAYRGPLGSITRYLAKTKAYRYLTVGSPLTIQHLLQNTMTRPESKRPRIFFRSNQVLCVFVHKNNRAHLLDWFFPFSRIADT